MAIQLTRHEHKHHGQTTWKHDANGNA